MLKKIIPPPKSEIVKLWENSDIQGLIFGEFTTVHPY